MAPTSSVNCLPFRIPYQNCNSLNASKSFSENRFSSLISASSHALPQSPLQYPNQTRQTEPPPPSSQTNRYPNPGYTESIELNRAAQEGGEANRIYRSTPSDSDLGSDLPGKSSKVSRPCWMNHPHSKEGIGVGVNGVAGSDANSFVIVTQ